MVNIEIARQAMASVLLSLFHRSIYGTLAWTWGWKVFLSSVFLATRRKKPRRRLLGLVFLDCLLIMVG
jgi:hypothetical protein